MHPRLRLSLESNYFWRLPLLLFLSNVDECFCHDGKHMSVIFTNFPIWENNRPASPEVMRGHRLD